MSGSANQNHKLSLPTSIKNQPQTQQKHPLSSASQLQTIATVHHQSSHQPVNNPTHLHRGPQIKASTGVTIPPRYQPPPQPPSGILKHLSTTGKQPSFFQAELSAPQLNIKYPPDIPKLSTVYIPDSDKGQSNTARFQNQRQPLQRTYILANQQQEDNHILRSQQEMLKFVRKSDQDHAANGIGASSGRLTAEQNRQLQSLISELRSLKEANQRLNDDNQELRDLCCFLDDDRQKGRKLAREWQRFGRYTASVMRQEVSAYQNKLRQLDDKQQELIRDNLELKELCLYLDEERAHVASNSICSSCGSAVRPTLRDDGDGSSYSTNADENGSNSRAYDRQIADMHLRPTLSDQTLQYVRSLEQRVQQLEEERISGNNNLQTIPDPISGRPEAVVRALQVLEVREQLERDRLCNLSETQIEQMDDGEKALVREMCNVVWRKLEEIPNGENLDE